MATLKYRPSEPLTPPAGGVKAATFALLLDTAMALIRQDGHIPTVAEVAVRSQVSRATAYRYFPSRSALITAVVDASLGAKVNVAGRLLLDANVLLKLNDAGLRDKVTTLVGLEYSF